jgi:hypothetical protein
MGHGCFTCIQIVVYTGRNMVIVVNEILGIFYHLGLNNYG